MLIKRFFKFQDIYRNGLNFMIKKDYDSASQQFLEILNNQTINIDTIAQFNLKEKLLVCNLSNKNITEIENKILFEELFLLSISNPDISKNKNISALRNLVLFYLNNNLLKELSVLYNKFINKNIDDFEVEFFKLINENILNNFKIFDGENIYLMLDNLETSENNNLFKGMVLNNLAVLNMFNCINSNNIIGLKNSLKDFKNALFSFENMEFNKEINKNTINLTSHLFNDYTGFLNKINTLQINNPDSFTIITNISFIYFYMNQIKNSIFFNKISLDLIDKYNIKNNISNCHFLYSQINQSLNLSINLDNSYLKAIESSRFNKTNILKNYIEYWTINERFYEANEFTNQLDKINIKNNLYLEHFILPRYLFK